MTTAHPCPRCGTDSEPGLRFCRRCGASLEANAGALVGPDRGPLEARLTKEEANAALWIAARGVVTVLIALPVFLLTLPFVAGDPVTPALAVIFLVFVVLGIRDLRRAYSALAYPKSAAAQDRPANPIDTGEPPSVTEHTTYRLEDRPPAAPTTRRMS